MSNICEKLKLEVPPFIKVVMTISMGTVILCWTEHCAQKSVIVIVDGVSICSQQIQEINRINLLIYMITRPNNVATSI